MSDDEKRKMKKTKPVELVEILPTDWDKNLLKELDRKIQARQRQTETGEQVEQTGEEAIKKMREMREMLEMREVRKETQKADHRHAYIDFAKYIAAISIAVFTGVYNILDEIDCPCVSILVQNGLSYARVGLLFLFISFSCATVLIFCQLPRKTYIRLRHSRLRHSRLMYGRSMYIWFRCSQFLCDGLMHNRFMHSRFMYSWLRCIGSESCARFMAFLAFWSLVAGVVLCLPHISTVIMSKT